MLAVEQVVSQTAPPPSSSESFCAWYGDDRHGVLYFGEAAFWAAFRASGGDPFADLAQPGPQRIGRFALWSERLLPPLSTAVSEAATGTWDVLAHPNGRVYFTTFFGNAGYVELASGRVRRFKAAGAGLNELALLPEGLVLASRYAPADGGNGSVVILDEEGHVEAEYALANRPGWRVAAKSVAFDPVRREIWVTTDLIPEGGGEPRHDARVLGFADGAERVRLEDPEIQAVRFAADGAGALVERSGSRLFLRLRPGGSAADPARSRARMLLDAHFPSDTDFAQDVRISDEGSVIVTRWSGRLHLIDRQGTLRSLALPRSDPGGLYYTTVLADGRLCATHCSGVTIVCAPVP